MSHDSKAPRIIGVTGGLGSGKTEVCRFLRRRQVPVICADEIARCLMRPGHPVYDRTVAEFGQAVLDAEENLDRRRLGALIFSDAGARRRLNEITHPAILKEMRRQMAELAGRTQVVVLDIPLLYEEGLEYLCDEVWVVWCRREQQVRRVMLRDGLGEEEVSLRLEAQMPLEQKAGRADLVIDNSGSRDRLREQLEDIWGRWSEDRGIV